MMGLYRRLLEYMLQREINANPTADIARVVSNRHFTHSLCACVIEIYLLILDHSSLGFSTLLKLLHIPPLDIWKHLGVFANLFPKLPVLITFHLKELESKIAVDLAWRSDIIIMNERCPQVFIKRQHVFFKE